jgi:glycosyltransferase involved in cell wall biosynthesis
MGDESGQKPKISVIMPAYNEEYNIGEVIQSVQTQTFADWELIIVNDASTDKTEEIVKKYFDERIKLINNEKNLGRGASRNKAIAMATGQYIAIWDADDTCDKTRFEKQVKFLDENSDVAVCGSWGRKIVGDKVYEFKHPLSYDIIRKGIIKRMLVIHSSVFIRSTVAKENLYNPKFKRSQDYELFLRLVKKYKVVNIPEFLIDFDASHSHIKKVRSQLWHIKSVFYAIFFHGYSKKYLFRIPVLFFLVLFPENMKKWAKKVLRLENW